MKKVKQKQGAKKNNGRQIEDKLRIRLKDNKKLKGKMQSSKEEIRIVDNADKEEIRILLVDKKLRKQSISQMSAQQVADDAANKILENKIIKMKQEWSDLTASIDDMQREYNKKLRMLSKQRIPNKRKDGCRVSKSSDHYDQGLVHSFAKSLLHLSKTQKKMMVAMFGSVCELLEEQQTLINCKDKQMNKFIKQMQKLTNQQQFKAEESDLDVIRTSMTSSNNEGTQKKRKRSLDRYKDKIKNLQEKNQKLEQKLSAERKKNESLRSKRSKNEYLCIQKLQEIEYKNQRLEQEFSDEVKKNERLRTQMNSFDGAADSEIRALKGALRAVQQQLNACQSEMVDEPRGESSRRRERKRKKDGKSVDSKFNPNEMRREVSAHRSEMKKNERLRKQMNLFDGAADSQITALKGALRALQQQLNACQSEKIKSPNDSAKRVDQSNASQQYENQYMSLYTEMKPKDKENTCLLKSRRKMLNMWRDKLQCDMRDMEQKMECSQMKTDMVTQWPSMTWKGQYCV